jgi:cell division protein FtsB
MSASALAQEFVATQPDTARVKRPATERRRIPLSIVPNVAPQKRGRLAILLGIILAVALGAVLVLNITVSNGQYDVVKLRGEETILSQQNESLRQQAEYLQSPQNLAAAAAKLGMVAPGTTATIDLTQGKVFGTTTAATSESPVGQLVSMPQNPVTTAPGAIDPAKAAPAEANAPVQDVTPEQPAPEMPVPAQAEAGAKPEENSHNTADNAPETPAANAEKDSAAEPEASRPKFDKKSLNGGSIPAPSVTEP